MSVYLIVGLVVAWMFISAVVVVCASMMSSQISKAEEHGAQPERHATPHPLYAALDSQRVPTQPRSEIVH